MENNEMYLCYIPYVPSYEKNDYVELRLWKQSKHFINIREINSEIQFVFYVQYLLSCKLYASAPQVG